MARIIHHIKRLLYIIIIATTFLLSKEGFAQCDDMDYYVAGNPNNSCFIVGNDITLTYPSSVYFNIKDSSGNQIWNSFPLGSNTSVVWPNAPSGTYTIEAFSPTSFPFSLICDTTITIAPGQVGFLSSPINLQYCQWNTINLADTISAYYLQNETNPQYTFTDTSGTPINGTNYYINTSGLITINVTVLDASGCTDTAQIIIDVQANNINTQSYTISDTVIQYCINTSVDFDIDNPKIDWRRNDKKNT